MLPDTKECSKCKTPKPLSDFNRAAKSKDGHRTECKECQRRDVKAYYEKIWPAPTVVENLPPIEFNGKIYDEEWRMIESFPHRPYMVSNFGRVKAMPFKWNRTEVLKRQFKQSADLYFYVKLSNNKKETHISVHRLVAMAFHDNPLHKPQVNHIDGNKLNNFFKNLEWATAKENSIHSVVTGLRNPSKGEDRFNAKLNKEKVLSIIKSDLDDVILSKEYGVSVSVINSVRWGRSWRSVTNLEETKKYDQSFIKMVNDIAYSIKTIKELASAYGLSYWMVRNIKSGKSHNRFTNIKQFKAA